MHLYWARRGYWCLAFDVLLKQADMEDIVDWHGFKQLKSVGNVIDLGKDLERSYKLGVEFPMEAKVVDVGSLMDRSTCSPTWNCILSVGISI